MFNSLRFKVMEFRLGRGKTISNFERYYLDRRWPKRSRKGESTTRRLPRAPQWNKPDYTLRPAVIRKIDGISSGVSGSGPWPKITPYEGRPKPRRVQCAHERWPELCGRVRTSN